MKVWLCIGYLFFAVSDAYADTRIDMNRAQCASLLHRLIDVLEATGMASVILSPNQKARAQTKATDLKEKWGLNYAESPIEGSPDEHLRNAGIKMPSAEKIHSALNKNRFPHSLWFKNRLRALSPYPYISIGNLISRNISPTDFELDLLDLQSAARREVVAMELRDSMNQPLHRSLEVGENFAGVSSKLNSEMAAEALKAGVLWHRGMKTFIHTHTHPMFRNFSKTDILSAYGLKGSLELAGFSDTDVVLRVVSMGSGFGILNRTPQVTQLKIPHSLSVLDGELIMDEIIRAKVKEDPHYISRWLLRFVEERHPVGLQILDEIVEEELIERF